MLSGSLFLSLPLSWFSALFFEATLSLKDANKLRTFDAEAKAAAAAAPSSSSDPPPAPPPPSLVEEEDDAAVGPGGGLVACVAAMLAIVSVV